MPDVLPTAEVLRGAYPIGWRSRTLIECGAAREGRETMPLAADNDCWFIEADPDYLADLGRLTGGTRTLGLALTDHDGEVVFHRTTLYGNGSVNHSDTHLRELASGSHRTERVVVPCVSYRTLIERHVRGPVDCLVLDVEGNETTILRSLGGLPPPAPLPAGDPPAGPQRPARAGPVSLPAVMVIECGYDWADRLRLLRELGYRLDFYQFNNAYLSLPGAVDTDAGYVRRVGWDRFEWFGQVIFDVSLPGQAPEA